MKTKQQAFPKLAKAMGLSEEVYLKREDTHKYGSHKGRSIPLMIKQYVREGVRQFVISSSGNAALAAILATEAHNQNNPEKQISLRVFVGQHIDLKKLDVLRGAIVSNAITLEQVERPKQQAFQIDKAGDAKSLRQSTDDLALEGYKTLAFELAKIPNLAAVFVGTSSGTTAQGLAEGFAEKEVPVEIHIVQTPACHPIADSLDADLPDGDTSIAGAIVDKVAHRKQAVVDAVSQSGGAAWVVSDDQLREAQRVVKDLARVEISTNSALSVAALQKAAQSGRSWNGPVVCLICGR